MAISVAILNPIASGGVGGGNMVCNASLTFIVAVTNPAADAARSITSIAVSESTESDAQISQPNFLTAGAPPGTGQPVILAGATLYFPFPVVFNSPNAPGVSPSNAPGGAAPGNRAMEADANFTLIATVVTADGQVVSGSVTVPVLSAIAPALAVQGGALIFSNPMNLAGFLAAFA